MCQSTPRVTVASFKGLCLHFSWNVYIILLCIFSLSPVLSQSFPLQAVPDIDHRAYSSLGDINIGVFIAASSSGGPASCLNKTSSGSSVIEHSEAVAFAVKTVNENPRLLPNITLGFVQVNDCGNENVALAVALSFLPRVTNPAGSMKSCLSKPSVWKESLNATADNNLDQMQFYDVVGVIGPMTSQRTIPLSKLFATARIPIISCLASSDELSDKSRHPYFSRLIPPDKYQVGAMLQFIQDNAWSYISIIYAKDSFGQKLSDQLKEKAPNYGICVAASHIVDDYSNFDDVVSNLLTFQRARVVVLFIYSRSSVLLLNSVIKLNASGYFIWIWSDAWNTALKKMPISVQNTILGSFTVGLYSTYIPAYFEYLSHLRVNNTTNPWFKSQWEDLANCSLDNDPVCDTEFDMFTSENFGFEKTPSIYIDAVYTFSHALHSLILDMCPGANGKEVRQCIQGDLLLKYLRNVSFMGYNGHIQFDEFGDLRGKYEIRQVVNGYNNIPFVNRSSTATNDVRTVAVYDVDIENLTYTDFKITWEYIRNIKRLSEVPAESPLSGVPESVCSVSCGVGEYKVQREPMCCWDCRKCRDNEKVSIDGASCQVCDLLTWPDPHSGYNSCAAITPTYPLVTDTMPIILICLGLSALVCVSLVAIGYIHFRNSRVIKAASRELSISQLVAMYAGYITIILFQTPPSPASCGALYFLFCLSFTLLYAPLLIKTIRVFRIFQNGEKHNQNPRLVSPCSQMAMAGALLAVQMVLCLGVYVTFTPTATSVQPIPTEKFVELSCDLTFPGLASFVIYNLVLVFLCSIFAFKTRKLPDNFNESKFISMCVTTTLVIWLAFVPTYFTANRNSIRIMLLSVALLLNHTVALIFLFAPKLYAAAYLPAENFTTTRFQSAVATTDAIKRGFSNRITPLPDPEPITSKKM